MTTVPINAFQGIRNAMTRNPRLAATVGQLSRGYSSMSGKIDNRSGSRYEQQTGHLALRYARRRFGFRSAAITHRFWQHGALLADATGSDLSADRDAGNLLNAAVAANRLGVHIVTIPDYNADPNADADVDSDADAP